MDDVQLASLLGEEIIFSRMAPEHKLRLVGAFQKQGEVVAVVGDGVNDTPALSKADIGIAMGISGTDVAREAADVILVEDNFAMIVRAIAEGRAVYDNLRKFITYIFSSNIPEIMPFILSVFFHIPLALTVPQILAIDLGTDLLPALALGTERPETVILQRKPRRKDQALVDTRLLLRSFAWLGTIETILCMLGFFSVYFLQGYPIIFNGFTIKILGNPPLYVYMLATTVFHAGVVACQIGNVFACRSDLGSGRRLGWFTNRYLLGGIVIEAALILGIIYYAPLARIFDHVALTPYYWIGLSMFGLTVFALEEGRKLAIRFFRWRVKASIKE